MGDSVKIIGVEPEAAPKMKKSVEAGKIVEIPVKSTIADGLVTKKPGDLTYQIISECVDDIVTVSDNEIAHAIFMLLERGKTLAEGAGAAALAAILSGKVDVRGKNVVAIISGGNIDLTLLSRIVNRELVREKRIMIIKGELPDRPGQLKEVLGILARARINILEVIHNRYDPMLEPGWARVKLIVEVPNPELIDELLSQLKSYGYMFRVEE